MLALKLLQGSIWGMSDETCRLAAADGDPRGAGVRSNQEWPDRECPDPEYVDLRCPDGGVLAGLLDLPVDGLRTLGEDHGNRCPAQRSALRMYRRRHPGRGVHLDGGTFVLRRLFRRRHQYRLWPPAD